MLSKVMDPERLESIKAGIMGALVGVAVTIFFVGLDHMVLGNQLFSPVAVLQIIPRLVVAAICSFLFGVTYRYIVRQDQSPHLRSGAVGAFALTRGLSQLETIELSELSLANALPLGLPLVESFGLFLTVRLVLDLGLNKQWLKPFTTPPSPMPH